MKTSKYTTKVTYLKGIKKYGCRVFYKNILVVEGRADSRLQIGPVFRDLMRTLDKLGGDDYTSFSRYHRYKEGNLVVNVKHIWYK